MVKAGENIEKKCEEKLVSVVKELAVGLSKKVYSSEGIAVIEDTRVVLDLTTMANKLKEHGASPVKLAATGFQRFKTAVDRVPVTSLR